MKAKQYRYLPLVAAELPVAVLAAGAAAEGDFRGALAVLLVFHLIFAPSLAWALTLGVKELGFSVRQYVFLAGAQFFLASSPYLEKYMGSWVFFLCGGAYFAVNAVLLAVFRRYRFLLLFLTVFVLQMCLLYFCIPAD